MNEKLHNFLTTIKNSQGANTFRSQSVNGVDVLKNGDLSCAYFVSGILVLYQLIDRAHFRLDGTIEAMQKSNWFLLGEPVSGSIVVWNPIKQGETEHLHIGFSIGDGVAISNRSSLGVPGEHPLHYSGLDKENKEAYATIRSIYGHAALGHGTIVS